MKLSKLNLDRLRNILMTVLDPTSEPLNQFHIHGRSVANIVHRGICNDNIKFIAIISKTKISCV